MEDEDVIDTHQLYPWRRTLDNSVYKDLLKVLGPARPGCFRRSALTVVPSVYCPLYAYMNPVPGHGVWINKSTMILYVVRIHEPIAWPRSLDKQIYNDTVPFVGTDLALQHLVHHTTGSNGCCRDDSYSQL